MPRAGFWLIAACVSAAAGPASAEPGDRAPALKLADASYSEEFAASKTRSLRGLSSRLVVGLHYGTGTGPFRASRILVPGTLAKATSYCVKLSSGDAQYRSLNRYLAEGGKDAFGPIETHSRFEESLARAYTASDVAIKVTASKLCTDDDDLTLVPAIPPGASAGGSLAVYVNAQGSRAQVGLVNAKGASIATGTCAPADSDAIVTYTERCEVPLAGGIPAGTRLQVKVLGEPTQSFALLADGR